MNFRYTNWKEAPKKEFDEYFCRIVANDLFLFLNGDKVDKKEIDKEYAIWRSTEQPPEEAYCIEHLSHLLSIAITNQNRRFRAKINVARRNIYKYRNVKYVRMRNNKPIICLYPKKA